MIVKSHSGKTIVDSLKIADTFFTRFKGLMGTKELREGEGLLIKPCNGIHMFWMTYSLDIIFLDKDDKVVHLIEGIKPWKVSPIVEKSKMVLELPVGTIKKYSIKLGDTIYISDT